MIVRAKRVNEVIDTFSVVIRQIEEGIQIFDVTLSRHTEERVDDVRTDVGVNVVDFKVSVAIAPEAPRPVVADDLLCKHRSQRG